MLRTLRRWFSGHGEVPEDPDIQACLMAMALDLELFTPSPSGRTPMDRFLRDAAPASANDGQALEALGRARWRLTRVVERVGPDEVVLSDLLSGERLSLIDDRMSATAAGALAPVRLCPLASGRYVLISPLFTVSEATLSVAMGFVRPGKGLGDGYRCAAVIYRDMARRGFMPMPQVPPVSDPLELIKQIRERLSDAERLALRWLAHPDPSSDADLMADIRRAASTDSLIDACGCFGQGAPEHLGLGPAFEAVARIQMETLVGRVAAGVVKSLDALNLVRDTLAGHIAAGRMRPLAGDLFERLAARWTPSGQGPAAGTGGAESPDLSRVLHLIQALRARTVQRGCSEAEAMAAASKIAELLDRHDLTLDEISVRRGDCEGVTIDTGRRRRSPPDACVPSIAAFCDCRAWSEATEGGALRYVFFGLKADVHGARLLHELVEAAFDNETARFRSGPTYGPLTGARRRLATTSFQIGLAKGITGKLDTLRGDRATRGARASGFDLVAVKRTVVDEELEHLGLAFVSRARRSRRFVDEGAYDAGRVAGALFEPRASLA